MNRIERSEHYALVPESPGGEEEDYPRCQTRGNIRNRNFYEFRLDGLGQRLHTLYTSNVCASGLGGYYRSEPLLLAASVGSEYDQYQGRTAFVQDIHLTYALTRPLYMESETVPSILGYPDDSFQCLFFLVLDHQYDPAASTVLDLAQVFDLDGFTGTFPLLRDERPEYLLRYEVLAYDILHIDAKECYEYQDFIYVAAEAAIVEKRFIRRRALHRNGRMGVKEINLRTLLAHESFLSPGLVLPQNKQLYFGAYSPAQQLPVGRGSFAAAPTLSMDAQVHYSVTVE